jgi:hypothetical protein
VQQVIQVQVAQSVPRAMLVPQDQLVQRVHKVFKVIRVQQDPLVLQVLQDRKASKVFKVKLALQDRLGQQDRLVLQVTQVQVVPRGQQGLVIQVLLQLRPILLEQVSKLLQLHQQVPRFKLVTQ